MIIIIMNGTRSENGHEKKNENNGVQRRSPRLKITNAAHLSPLATAQVVLRVAVSLQSTSLSLSLSLSAETSHILE